MTWPKLNESNQRVRKTECFINFLIIILNPVHTAQTQRLDNLFLLYKFGVVGMLCVDDRTDLENITYHTILQGEKIKLHIYKMLL